jgi:hypothetical protein
MNSVVEFKNKSSHVEQLAARVNENVTRLSIEVELQERLNEAHATDKKLVQDFICSFCLSFPSNPVMCSECEKVFCIEEQKTFYRKPDNVACSMCRVEA